MFFTPATAKGKYKQISKSNSAFSLFDRSSLQLHSVAIIIYTTYILYLLRIAV